MKKIIIPFAACALLLSSCSQSRLEIPQKGVIPVDNFYKTDEDAEMAIVSAYDVMFTQYTSVGNDNIFTAIWNYPGDDMIAAGNNKTDNIMENELHAFRYPVTSGMISGAYNAFYRTVYTANLAIDHFKDGLPEKGHTDVTRRVVAEAKVIRALQFMQLGFGWGTPPIVDHVLDAADKPGNAESQKAVYEFVIKDCEEALPYLRERKGPEDKNGAVIVTKALAYTIIGKTKLFMEDYAGAQEALAKVIDSGNYKLVDGKDLENSFHASGDGNSEKVFELNNVYDSSIGSYNNHAQKNANWLWNWRNDVMQIPNGKGTVMYKTGWGECNPSQKFVDVLIENDGMDSYRRKAWIKNYDEVLYDMPYATDGDSFAPGKTAFKESDPKRGIYRPSGLYGSVGWFMWKVNVQTQDLSPNNRGMANFRIFRLPEIYLMYAECAVKTGKDVGKALDLVNEIQRRAGSKTVSTELTMDVVKREKMIECWLEGCRYQDILRWKDYDELKLNGRYFPNYVDKLFSGGSVHEGYIDESDADWCVKLYPDLGFNEKKHLLFPFPYSEISINPNIKQNPGWE